MKQLANIAISVFVSGLALFGGVAPLAAHNLPMRQAELCAEAVGIIVEGSLLLMSADESLQNIQAIDDEEVLELAVTYGDIYQVLGRIYYLRYTINIIVPHEIQEQWMRDPATETTGSWFTSVNSIFNLGNMHLRRSLEERQGFDEISQYADELTRIAATMGWNCGQLLREAEQ